VRNRLGQLVRCGCVELIRALRLLRDAAREIFDEAAYSRYLARHDVENSAEAYQGFLREGEQARERKPRCC
jgi:hypothetical protein